ncbi:hypothetical protein BGZ70_009316 [Mortierella alpina]|uniref:EF-hand domain-containing protein n=1 Tax=Mortierella alpina TaxID=64518 RepID=A0A9P6LZX0_MORAP|nr:hypothetical protein BGZ70_009316 [Mortierella alpina]
MASTPVIHPLQEDALQILRATFDGFDVNKDGRLSTEELLRLLASLKVTVTNDEAISAIKSFDADKDGALNCQEFLSLMTLLKNMTEKNTTTPPV